MAVIFDRCIVVVGHPAIAEIIDRLIVMEAVTVPASAGIAAAKIAEPVVDPAIIADRRTPVRRIPTIIATAERPISRRPQQPGTRGQGPDPRHPVIAAAAMLPEARRPDVAFIRHRRLIVFGQWRRRLGNLSRSDIPARCGDVLSSRWRHASGQGRAAQQHRQKIARNPHHPFSNSRFSGRLRFMYRYRRLRQTVQMGRMEFHPPIRFFCVLPVLLPGRRHCSNSAPSLAPLEAGVITY